MFVFLAVILAILMVNKPAGTVTTADTQKQVSQCRDLIVQHILTFGRSQIDPEVVRNCFTLLRSENLEFQEQGQFKDVITNKFSEREREAIQSKLVDLQDSASSGKSLEKPKISSDLWVKESARIKKEELKGKINKNELSKKDFRELPPNKKKEVIDLFQENILQEWPAVENVRKKKTIGESNSLTEKQCKDLVEQYGMASEKSHFDPEVIRNCINMLIHKNINYLEQHQTRDPITDDSAGKQTGPNQFKSEAGGTEAIYPEKILQEWPAVELTRKKKSIEEPSQTKLDIERVPANSGKPSVLSNYIENGFFRTENEKGQEELKGLITKDNAEQIPPKKNHLLDMYPENFLQEWPAVEKVRNKRAVGTVQKARIVKAVTKPLVNFSWEKYTLHDAMTLDERSRPQMSFFELIIHKIMIIWNYLAAKMGLGPHVIQS